MKLFNRFVREEEGADATEYALMLGLIALVIVGAVSGLGSALGNKFGDISNSVNAAGAKSGS